MSRLFVVILFFSLGAWSTYAQDGLLSIYNQEDFLRRVRDHHPMAVNAEILNRNADANSLMAKGGFDPKLGASFDRKTFDDKTYFTVLEGGLKIPTWYGVELDAGYSFSNGEFLNPADNLPVRGLWNAGISVPLGRGLVLDDRRAALQQAEVYRDATEQQQRLMLNDLLQDAADAYVQWQFALANRAVASQGVALARFRLDFTRSSWRFGDVPAIDTLEAYINLQARYTDSIMAAQMFMEKRLEVANYLWLDGVIPLEPDLNIVPETLDPIFLARLQDSLQLFQEELLANHPDLLSTELDIQSLNIDRRLQREDLKPDLRVKYAPLVGTTDDRVFDTFRASDVKWSANFSYPLLLRKERGKIQMTDVKIDQKANDLLFKRLSLKNKAENFYNQTNLLQDQSILLANMVVNQQRLLDAEYRKLEIGESSMFLVNSRELKLIETSLKLNEVQQKVLKNRIKYLHTLGVWPNIINQL